MDTIWGAFGCLGALFGTALGTLGLLSWILMENGDLVSEDVCIFTTRSIFLELITLVRVIPEMTFGLALGASIPHAQWPG